MLVKLVCVTVRVPRNTEHTLRVVFFLNRSKYSTGRLAQSCAAVRSTRVSWRTWRTRTTATPRTTMYMCTPVCTVCTSHARAVVQLFYNNIIMHAIGLSCRVLPRQGAQITRSGP